MGLLRITEGNALERMIKYINDILTVPVVYSKTAQAIILKSVVPGLEWFDSDQTKFKD